MAEPAPVHLPAHDGNRPVDPAGVARPTPELAHIEHPSLELPTREKLIVMVAVMLGLFLSALDQTIVGVALPSIVSQLHGSDLYTWVVTAYLLTSTITVPIYGKLGDVFGRQRMLIVGILLFLAGSALSGLSQNMGELIAFRALQGCGAGSLFPISLAVIGDLFTPRERGRYQGLFGAVFGVSFIVGPFLGGVITDDISWHWIFYVNVPVGIVALAAIFTRLPNFKATAARLRDLDYLGIAIFTVAVIPILIGLTFKGLTDSSGSLYGWTDWRVGGMLLAGIAILAVFALNEARARQPIIPLDLFTDRTLAATNVATLMVSCSMFAAVIFIPLYYQVVKGVSATASGYSMWPLLLGLIGTSIGAGQYLSRTGRYKVLLVSALCVLGLGSWLLTHLSPTTPTALLWLWLGLTGIGVGPTMSVFTVVIQNAAPRQRLGTATSTLTFLRQVGGAIGLAVAGTVFSENLSSQLPQQLSTAHLPAALTSHIASPGTFSENNIAAVGNLGQTILQSVPARIVPTVRPFIGQIVDALHNAMAFALADVFWVALVTAVLGLLATLAIREIPLRGSARRAGGAQRERHDTADSETTEVVAAV
ncbi:MAG TPA: MDR family MFS transporter [Candidatus Binatia bacterium]|nr:MDR family MFS transporter [Candidatus Binatia bacterium]